MTPVEIIVSVVGALLIAGYITVLYLIADVGTREDSTKDVKTKK